MIYFVKFVLAFLLLACLGRWMMRSERPWHRKAFAVLNLMAGFYVHAWLYRASNALGLLSLSVWTIYVALALLTYLFLRRGQQHQKYLLAFVTPLVFLMGVRFVPREVNAFYDVLAHCFSVSAELVNVGLFVGVSYMTFRLCSLVIDVRNEKTPLPDVWEYLTFAFFLPTLLVGPISAYRTHYHSLQRPPPPLWWALGRVMAGLLQLMFLSAVFAQFNFDGLLTDGRMHLPIDLLIAAFGTFFYIYFNFAGISDVAIGLGALAGVRVDENFNRPFLARNVRDFWARWHMTLTGWMRDLIFLPFVKNWVRKKGTRTLHHANAVATVVVFWCIGLWHGVTWGWFVMVSLHAVVIILVEMFWRLLVRWSTPQKINQFRQHGLVHGFSVLITFVFVSSSLIFFERDLDNVMRLLQVIRW